VLGLYVGWLDEKSAEEQNSVTSAHTQPAALCLISGAGTTNSATLHLPPLSSAYGINRGVDILLILLLLLLLSNNCN
jgi:hypothetical protein